MLQDITAIFAAMNITINITPKANDTGHDIELLVRGRRIAHMSIIVSTGTIEDYRKMKEDIPVLHIPWIHVEETHQGHGIASLLLLYGLLYEHEQNPRIEFATLDDDSDRSNSISGNIYEKVGYVHVNVPTEVVNKDGVMVWKLHGPERQLRLNEAFQARAKSMIESYKERNKHTKLGKKSKQNRYKRHSRKRRIRRSRSK